MTEHIVMPGPIHGFARLPASKSYTHRAIVIGWLSRERFTVDGPLDSDDTRATARGVVALGARWTRGRSRWTITPTESGSAPNVRCRSSGSTLRFLAAAAAQRPATATFTGSDELARRPIAPLLRTLSAHGARVDSRRGLAGIPFTVTGPAHAGNYSVESGVSSQFGSALLMLLPTLAGPSRLALRGHRASEPYLESTTAILSDLGIRLGGTVGRWRIPGRQGLSRARFRVPFDASSAAYLLAAAAITGGTVTLRGWDDRFPQADSAILPILSEMGASVERRASRVTVSGPLTAPAVRDVTATPDLFPLVAVLAASVPLPSRISGGAHAAWKESDRIAGAARVARALGARVERSGSAMRIVGRKRPRRFSLRNETDHRIVMSAAVGALAANGPCRISDARCVAKSFPGFWRTLREVGGAWERAR